MFKGRLIPNPIMEVILSGFLNSAWGNFHRSTTVRLTVYGNNLEIGIGEGNMYEWELNTLRRTRIEHGWIAIEAEELRTVCIEGTKYIPEKRISGMPRGLIPTWSSNVYIFVDDYLEMIFPAYRCFDINFGGRRILSILSPRTLIRDIAEAIHPVFPEEKYRGRVNNVEVKVDAFNDFLEKNYGIGMLRKEGSVKMRVEAFPLLGEEDIKVILESISKGSRNINRLASSGI